MPTPIWYERSLDRLESALERGDLSSSEYRAELRALNEDLREQLADRARYEYEEATEEW